MVNQHHLSNMSLTMIIVIGAVVIVVLGVILMLLRRKKGGKAVEGSAAEPIEDNTGVSEPVGAAAPSQETGLDNTAGSEKPVVPQPPEPPTNL